MPPASARKRSWLSSPTRSATCATSLRGRRRSGIFSASANTSNGRRMSSIACAACIPASRALLIRCTAKDPREEPSMDVVLANPRGFCAGVERAIEIVERALAQFGAPIYVRHEIVHNKYVVENLRAKGAVFVEELDEVPKGATVIFSAHGVPK